MEGVMVDNGKLITDEQREAARRNAFIQSLRDCARKPKTTGNAAVRRYKWRRHKWRRCKSRQ